MPKNTCDFCRFAEPARIPTYQYADASGWATEEGFLCKRFPDVQKKFPDDWCGEFQMKDLRDDLKNAKADYFSVDNWWWAALAIEEFALSLNKLRS